MAGYSEKSLSQKLGLKENMKAIFTEAPGTDVHKFFFLLTLERQSPKRLAVHIFRIDPAWPRSGIHFCTKEKKELENAFRDR